MTGVDRTGPDSGGEAVACVHCGAACVVVVYATGPVLMHRHPSGRLGSEYWHCPRTVWHCLRTVAEAAK